MMFQKQKKTNKMKQKPNLAKAVDHSFYTHSKKEQEIYLTYHRPFNFCWLYIAKKRN
jgi:hypothetical protein